MLLSFAAGAVPVPLPGDSVVDLKNLRVDNPAVVSTNGTWRFQLTRGAMVAGKFVMPVTEASTTQLPADNAIDGDEETRWCAESPAMPQWWQVDLGRPEKIRRVDLTWEFPDARYEYKIETSPDGRTWAPFDKGTGRYIRVTVTAATGADGTNKWASIREAKITVVRDGRDVLWKPVAATASDDSFAAPGFDDRDWHDLPVPSNWEVLGYSMPTYFGPDSAAGLYRRVIDIPASFKGKKIVWHCDGVTDSAEVWVNGHHAGYHEGGFTAFEMDLTPYLKPGEKNLLAVRVCKTTPTVDLDTGDFWLLGGIHRESYLVAVPADHIEDVTIVTKLDDQYKNATLSADLTVDRAAGHDVAVTARLMNVDGTPVDAVFDVAKTTSKAGLHMTVQSAVNAPRLWSAEKPNLYYLLLTLKSGDTTETIEQRFGFRQIDIKDGVLLWNGVPIKCCGMCRHEEWSALGHALTEHEWQTDVAMMKAANINAVRTSHYNHAERFLELCDEKGIYILDEIPACWVDPKDAKLKDAFVQHAVETLARDKNKPCVLAWSCGNESGWGPDFKAMIDYVAKTDPTRPRFVSCTGKDHDGNLSFNDYHYSDDHDLRNIAAGAGPSVITEGPHTFYSLDHQAYDYGIHDLWGFALARQWNRVRPSKTLFGAFIWEWQNQGLADQYPDKKGVNFAGLRRENNKGVVTGYRVPKPELYHVKMVYSPVVTDQREVQDNAGKEWSVEFQNRYAFTDLSELKCHWRAMKTTDGDQEIAAGDVVVQCPPAGSAAAVFPVTAGADTLRVGFVDPSGVEVYAARLHVAGAAVSQPPAASKDVQIKTDDDGRVTISNAAGLKITGPTLNLGEARVDEGDFANKNEPTWVQSKSSPVLKNAKVVTGATGRDFIVSADVTLAEHPDQVLGRLTYDLTTDPDGQIDWRYHLKWTSADRQVWDFGLKFDVPGDDKFSWYRRGQWTDYPAGHIGATTGSVEHADDSFRSTKRDTVWAAITPDHGGGVAIIATDGPLHTRCNYNDGVTTLFASTVVTVDHSFSSAYIDDSRLTLKQGRTYDGAFRMRLTAGKD